MRENILKIHINCSLQEAWNFTVDSHNISRWFDSIAEEIPSEVPTRKGTILRNRAPNSKVWNEYEVADYDLNKKFVLSQMNGNYNVEYKYVPLEDGVEIIYREWMSDGELENPEPQSTLEKLKRILEGKEV